MKEWRLAKRRTELFNEWLVLINSWTISCAVLQASSKANRKIQKALYGGLPALLLISLARHPPPLRVRRMAFRSFPSSGLQTLESIERMPKLTGALVDYVYIYIQLEVQSDRPRAMLCRPTWWQNGLVATEWKRTYSYILRIFPLKRKEAAVYTCILYDARMLYI